MALVSALFGQLRPSWGRATTGRGKVRQVILRGKSGRAYAFEVHRALAGAALGDIPAVYMYTREIYTRESPGLAGAQTNGPRFTVGFVGRTEAMGERASEHEQLGHFVGHGLDTLLILRVEHAPIRAAIAEDMLAEHRPVLNDLLGGYQDAQVA